MYEMIKGVTNDIVDECIVNELKHCVKETKHRYD